MSFEVLFLEELHTRGFGSQHYLRAFKKRPHVSKSKIDAFDNVKYLDVGKLESEIGYNKLKRRYMACTNLTYDIFLSIYDFNSSSCMAARFAYFTDAIRAQLRKYVGSIKRPNFELRLFGMQDGQDHMQLYSISDFISSTKLQATEIDLFGKEVRNIAIDLHTGMSYNILMLDRLYRPGELLNSTTIEQYEKSIMG